MRSQEGVEVSNLTKASVYRSSSRTTGGRLILFAGGGGGMSSMSALRVSAFEFASEDAMIDVVNGGEGGSEGMRGCKLERYSRSTGGCSQD